MLIFLVNLVCKTSLQIFCPILKLNCLSFNNWVIRVLCVFGYKSLIRYMFPPIFCLICYVCFVLCCFYWLQHTSKKMHNHKCTTRWIVTKTTLLNKGKNITKDSSPSVTLRPIGIDFQEQSSVLLVLNLTEMEPYTMFSILLLNFRKRAFCLTLTSLSTDC